MRLTDPEAGGFSTPLVSVVMANFQAGDKLAQAIQSVLAQSHCNIELIICDDASADDSMLIAKRFAREDARVKVIGAAANGGPARSRNRGLEAATGEWIAIVDSDDLIHPERFDRLLAVAAYSKADIVADDLLEFFEDGSPCKLFLDDGDNKLFAVSAEQWIAAGVDGTRPLGYLKPMMRRSALGTQRYDEALRIGEDYDLVLRLLLAGAKMVVFPEPFYLYRRHSASISHRLRAGDLEAMLESQATLEQTFGDVAPSVANAFAARRRQLSNGLAFERLVGAIKARRLAEAARILATDPMLGKRLWRSFAEGRQRKSQAAVPLNKKSKPLDFGTSGRSVPDYVPALEMDWTNPVNRRTWLKFASLSAGRPSSLHCSSASERYAAGFVPMATRTGLVAEAAE